MATTLQGERLRDAGIAYNKYAEQVKDDPMCMAFLEGVQWADNNPAVKWHTMDYDSVDEIERYAKQGVPVVILNYDYTIGDVITSLTHRGYIETCVKSFECWKPLWQVSYDKLNE